MDFVAIDFETTGYAGDASNDPWQLGVAVVQGGEIVLEILMFVLIFNAWRKVRGNRRGR